MKGSEINQKRIDLLEGLLADLEGSYLDSEDVELINDWITELKNTVTVEMSEEQLHSVYRGYSLDYNKQGKCT